MILHRLNRYRDLGLLILRVGIGLAFAFGHGLGKILGGPAGWEQLGGNAALVGLSFAPTFWGFMAALAEFGGGLLLALGFLFRPALILMIATMTVAATGHITGAIPGSPWHAIEMGILFLSLLLIGPGRYSIDARLHNRRRTGF